MCIASFEICIFFRDSEAIATQKLAPEAITRARNYEKLSETDARRFAIDGQDLSGLRMSYPIPREIDLRTAKHFAGAPDKPTLRKRPNNGVLDIFDSDIVYVAVEMLVNPLMPGNTSGPRDSTLRYRTSAILRDNRFNALQDSSACWENETAH